MPNDQFVVPFVTYEGNGSRIFNDSQKEVLISRLGEQTVTLGRYFLTASYIMVDYEENTFTMWNANPTTASNLKPVVRKDMINLCSNSSTVTDADAPLTSATPSMPSSPSGLSTAAMAGVIVGAAVAVLVTALAAFFFWRKRRQQARLSPPVLPPKERHGRPHELQVQEGHFSQPSSGWGSVWSSNTGYPKTELHQSYVQPQIAELYDAQARPARSEVEGSHKSVYEMAVPNQLPSTPLMQGMASRR